MIRKKLYIYILILVVMAVALIVSYFSRFNRNVSRQEIKVSNFEECQSSGYPISEIFPRQCSDNNGNVYIENVGNAVQKRGVINLENPKPNSIVTSPVNIKGEVRGTWFFEGQFPVMIFDSNGNKISEGIAKSDGDWMTDNFVPFSAVLVFEKVKTEKGELVLKKDNPSGLAKNDDELRIPIRFK